MRRIIIIPAELEAVATVWLGNILIGRNRRRCHVREFGFGFVPKFWREG